MQKVIELYQNQQIDDLSIGYHCKDEFVNKLQLELNIGFEYFLKAETLFDIDKQKAFEYYKLSYKNNYWLAPYMLGLYFEYGLDKFLKSPNIAFDFYKEAINRDDIRGYIHIAELIDNTKDKLTLWKKFFTHEILNNTDKREFLLTDFVNFNIDYRAIFIHKFKNQIKFETEIRKILQIIKPSIIQDATKIIQQIEYVIDIEEESDKIEILSDIINSIELVIENREDELFIIEEDMGLRLEKIITKKEQKWD